MRRRWRYLPAGLIPDGVGPEKFAVLAANFSGMWSILARMLGRRVEDCFPSPPYNNIHRCAEYSRPEQRGAAMTRQAQFFDIRGLVQVRLETVREARALRPGSERNQKRQIAQSLKKLIESQIQVRDHPPRRASRY